MKIVIFNLLMLPLNIVIVSLALIYQVSLRIVMAFNTWIGSLFLPIKVRISIIRNINNIIGFIYNIPARWVIHPDNWETYSLRRDIDGTRKVVVVKVRWWGTIIVAQLTTQNQGKYDEYYTKIEGTDIKPGTKIDPRHIKKNQQSKIRFKVWHFPFRSKQASSISKDKVEEHLKRSREYEKAEKRKK